MERSGGLGWWNRERELGLLEREKASQFEVKWLNREEEKKRELIRSRKVGAMKFLFQCPCCSCFCFMKPKPGHPKPKDPTKKEPKKEEAAAAPPAPAPAKDQEEKKE